MDAAVQKDGDTFLLAPRHTFPFISTSIHTAIQIDLLDM